jgi:hypothetical protein
MVTAYRKVPDELIHPLVLHTGSSAFEHAVDHYKSLPGIDFWNDLCDYHINGFVITRPDLFAMFKPIDRDGKRGWFIRYAYGDLRALVDHWRILPRLEFVSFCRNCDGVMRLVDTKKFIRWVIKLKGNKGIWAVEAEADQQIVRN